MGMVYKIISFTGPAGVGKSTILSMLQKIYGYPLLRRVTTRPERPQDIRGEFDFVNDEGFDRLIAAGALFEWVAVHGNRYGMRKEPIENTLALTEPSLTTCTIEGAEKLYDFLKSKGQEGAYLPIYLLADPDVLHARLLRRHPDGAEVEQRFAESKDWDERAKRSRVPFRFLENKENMQSETIGGVNALLNS